MQSFAISAVSVPHFSLVLKYAPAHLKPQDPISDPMVLQDIFCRAQKEFSSSLPQERIELENNNKFWLAISSKIALHKECDKINNLIKITCTFLKEQIQKQDEIVSEDLKFKNEEQRKKHLAEIRTPALEKKDLYVNLRYVLEDLKLDDQKIDAMQRGNLSEKMKELYDKLKEILQQIELDDFIELKKKIDPDLFFNECEFFLEKVMALCKIKFFSCSTREALPEHRKDDLEAAYQEYCNLLIKKGEYDKVIFIIRANFKEWTGARESLTKHLLNTFIKEEVYPRAIKFINEIEEENKRDFFFKFIFEKIAEEPLTVPMNKELSKINETPSFESRLDRVNKFFLKIPKKKISGSPSPQVSLPSFVNPQAPIINSSINSRNAFLETYHKNNFKNKMFGFLKCTLGWVDSVIEKLEIQFRVSDARLTSLEKDSKSKLHEDKSPSPSKRFFLDIQEKKTQEDISKQRTLYLILKSQLTTFVNLSEEEVEKAECRNNLIKYLKVLNKEELSQIEENMKSCEMVQFSGYEKVISKASLLSEIKSLQLLIENSSQDGFFSDKYKLELNELYFRYCIMILETNIYDENDFSIKKEDKLTHFTFIENDNVDWLVKHFLHKKITGTERNVLINAIIKKYIEMNLIKYALIFINEFVNDEKERNKKIHMIFEDHLRKEVYEENLKEIEKILKSSFMAQREEKIVKLFNGLVTSGTSYQPEKQGNPVVKIKGFFSKGIKM
jgi:hypothetical protein